MRIAITGSSGLVGTALTDHLRREGHRVTRLVRSRDAAAADDAIHWDPSHGTLEGNGLAEHDAVVNLAGENIAGVWTPAKKRRLRRSRVGGTALLAATMARMASSRRPSVLINASAVGYYGHRPADEPLDESAGPGTGFFPALVVDWERAATPAMDAGVRVVLARFGVILDAEALLVRASATATRLGLGATLGDGRQAFPWVTRADVVEAISFLLTRPRPEGAVNIVAPDPVTNREFADTMAGLLHRPRLLRIPSVLVRALGDLGDELLGGARVVPAKLQAAGYPWRHPSLRAALEDILAS